nr:MAG TPA: hypothetical protein [Caudoviricetes sp.]
MANTCMVIPFSFAISFTLSIYVIFNIIDKDR